MVSLKGKSKGFTIVELLIVIVVIGILATLVIVTFTGIQQKAHDSKRKTDINALDSHVEAFYANYGFYPTLKDISTASFQTSYMRGFDPSALTDPKGGDIQATTDKSHYSYVADGDTCANDTATTIGTDADKTPQDNGCTGFTATATLEAGGTYSKKSNT